MDPPGVCALVSWGTLGALASLSSSFLEMGLEVWDSSTGTVEILMAGTAMPLKGHVQFVGTPTRPRRRMVRVSVAATCQRVEPRGLTTTQTVAYCSPFGIS